MTDNKDDADAFWRKTWDVPEPAPVRKAEQRLVTVVVTVRTDADDAQLSNAIRQGLGWTDAVIVGCDWEPDPDTIADAVDPLDPEEADLHHVYVLDMNPMRKDA